MKARQDFEIFVQDGNVVPHYCSGDLGKKKRLFVKKGETVPKEQLSHLMAYNPDYLDFSTATKDEIVVKKTVKAKAKPLIENRKYSESSLRSFVNGKGTKSDDMLREILDKEFNVTTKIRTVGKLINWILVEQEKSHRGG